MQQKNITVTVEKPDYHPEITEAIEIGGVRIDTGLAWYWEVSIVISAILLIYAAKKSIDFWFLKKERRHAGKK